MVFPFVLELGALYCFYFKEGMGQMNSVRIIGGRFRGRVIRFPDLPGLRPTLGRVRETLFNWLMFQIQNRPCLDLYAGSGALGFEALSRGAQSVTFVDVHPLVCKALAENGEALGVQQRIQCLRETAQSALQCLVGQFYDLIFLDPPFHQGLLMPALEAILKYQLLSRGGQVYFEVERGAFSAEAVSAAWRIVRHQKTGEIEYGLLTRIL